MTQLQQAEDRLERKLRELERMRREDGYSIIGNVLMKGIER